MARGRRLPGGLRRRILGWFLVLSLVPLFLSNTVGYQVTRRILEGQARRYLTALTEVQARHVAGEVERHQQNLDAVVAGNALLADGVEAAAHALRAGRREGPAFSTIHTHLDRKLEELLPFTEIFALDTSGTVVASTLPSRLGLDWSGTELFRLGREGRAFHDDIDVIGGIVTPVYRLAAPIPNADGVAVGVLAATVGFQRVQAFLRIDEHVAGDVHNFVVDEAGRPLFASHPRPGLEYGVPLRSPLLVEGAEPVLQYANYEGEEVLGAAVPVPGHPWRYIAEAPVTSVFGQLRLLASLAAVLEATFALVLVAVVWMVARSIVSPLRRLVAAAERIRGGDLDVRVRIDRQDELGDLGRTFDLMSQELGSSARRIQELHDQEMRRAAQLASVGELASGIAHEIKNPLIGLSSGLDLLANRVQHDPRVETVVQQMRAQLGRIESALRDLLSYARPKEPHMVLADVRQVADRVVQLITPQAETAGVRIETRLAPDVPSIRLDPELMTQSLVNLTLNGIQAMRPGGVLTIAIARSDHDLRVAVSDTGGGIPEDQLARIFRPFYTTKHQGTGLGLAITRAIVERHGGRLDVASRPGHGSTFTLVFAVPRSEEATP